MVVDCMALRILRRSGHTKNSCRVHLITERQESELYLPFW